MYSLIVGAGPGSLPVERVLEGLDSNLADTFKPGGVLDVKRLLELPVLLMPEIGDSSSEQIARVGSVTSLIRAGRDYQLQFVPNLNIHAIPSVQIESAASRLGIGAWDLSRTRWTLKEPDLYRSLLEVSALEAPKPTAFRLPSVPPKPDTIAVMMPFDARFDRVWTAIQEVAQNAGWKCLRADDIWQNSAIIDDVVALIATSKVVVCDLTGRNANVFYEAGIAHTLGREVVLITQSPDDVPFDLKHHRYIHYLGNAEGVDGLKSRLSERVMTLMQR